MLLKQVALKKLYGALSQFSIHSIFTEVSHTFSTFTKNELAYGSSFL